MRKFPLERNSASGLALEAVIQSLGDARSLIGLRRAAICGHETLTGICRLKRSRPLGTPVNSAKAS